MTNAKQKQMNLLNSPEKIINITFLDGRTYTTRPQDLGSDALEKLKELILSSSAFVFAARTDEKQTWYNLTEANQDAILSYIM